ncbi:MAG: TlpA family protein disulfide reductase [Candidatus Latescibacteria bacterium]|nr:TlpA family protein disulfide reductase [Candidatus Latescibacterota bacterium]MBT5829458.1 TlpA family protein disulfide reductase [Candidatus Latescibacterota bacterium]
MKKIFGLLILGFVFLGRVDASPQIGQVAPNFECVTADGQTVQLSDYRGKVVILDFWASWCGPCREEMPFLVELYQLKGERDFEILGVNIDNKKKNMETFLSQLDDRPSFPILLDKEKKIAALYEIETMPTTIFIDRQGVIRFWHHGFTKSHKEKYRAELQLLLERDNRRVAK